MSLHDSFRQSLETLVGPDLSGPFGIALSGGGDSVALMALAADWAAPRGVALHTATIDHGLRPEAATEAAATGRQARALGLTHDILVWRDRQPGGNLPAQARAARYRLLADWARRRGLAAVLLGHTQDDNVESFVMGLARGAGLDGLSGMRPRFDRDGAVFLRPLLGAARAALREVLRARGLTWAEDPTNEDTSYDRVRIRKALAAAGVDQTRIAASVALLRASRTGLEAVLADWAGVHLRENLGDVVIDAAAFAALPVELRRRLLNAALRWVSGADYPPRADAVMRLAAGGWTGAARTLHGCTLRAEPRGLVIGREPGAAARAPAVASDAVWDGRWRLDGPHAPGLELRALGAPGLTLCPDWRATGAGRRTLLSSPAVWQGATLVAAPLAGRADGWRAGHVRSFAASLVPH